MIYHFRSDWCVLVTNLWKHFPTWKAVHDGSNLPQEGVITSMFNILFRVAFVTSHVVPSVQRLQEYQRGSVMNSVDHIKTKCIVKFVLHLISWPCITNYHLHNNSAITSMHLVPLAGENWPLSMVCIPLLSPFLLPLIVI